MCLDHSKPLWTAERTSLLISPLFEAQLKRLKEKRNYDNAIGRYPCL